MIYTKKKNLYRYLGQSPALDAAIHAALELDLEKLPMGRNEIDGDKAFVNRFLRDCRRPQDRPARRDGPSKGPKG